MWAERNILGEKGKKERAVFFVCLEGHCRPPGNDAGHRCCHSTARQWPGLWLLQLLLDLSCQLLLLLGPVCLMMKGTIVSWKSDTHRQYQHGPQNKLVGSSLFSQGLINKHLLPMNNCPFLLAACLSDS